jgi:DNA polymerase-3 subunit chi
MTRIDFYLNAESKTQVACKIALKAMQQDMKVLIMAPEESVAREIDRLLWMFPSTGFLPHCMIGDPLAAETPVLIARNGDTINHNDILLNLGAEAPAFFGSFTRLVEIVSRDNDEDKLAARARFKFYKDRGYELRHHDLAKT